MNDRIYIHEFIDIRGHNRANYMHHMTANWSPIGRELRHQLCYGVWALLGSTGAWPQTVNMWEEDGWDGLGSSFAIEATG
ncbi:MAG: family containing protein, partial [Ilumatobacteraceae bacterium]|nr:family containing protein [Ilumatobacteraceae bacterium]